MREINAIITSYEEAKVNGLSCVLATVVHVEGSSYRRAGARMLVDENGLMTGAISGGCLEGDALRKALHALHKSENKLVTYDTSDENDAIIGAQLGCNGVIQVLFEPINFKADNNPVELLKHAIGMNESMIIGTYFHLDKTQDQIGTIFLVDQNLHISGQVFPSELHSQIIADCQTALADNTSLFREYRIDADQQYLFLEVFTQPPTLVLVGAGNDAQVLAQMAELLGWNIVVTDGRPTHASSNRFASSCQVVVAKPEQILEEVEITDRTAFVLMTHNYKYDLSVLKVLLTKSDISYIGILGPEKKYQRMLDDLKIEGIELTQRQLDIIHAPVGLEIGAETPAEIGLSILSEIQSVLTETPGGKLKKKEGPIHRKKNNEFKQIIIG
ncbi:XdhC family protein [Ekhidna sp. To15]|uniref:XdhC family protein n=1 Tax=Ekhidna sp. To15 TaxID=3395267 RepID=UPI003F51CF63